MTPDPDPWWRDDFRAEHYEDWTDPDEYLAPTRDECRWIEQEARRNR